MKLEKLNSKELEIYYNGFYDGAKTDVSRGKITIMGYDLSKICDILCKHEEHKEMAKNLKYQWCEPDGATDKEFLGWIYERLHSVFGERLTLDYMQRLSKIVDAMPGAIPNKMEKILAASPDLAKKREAFREQLDKLGHSEATCYTHWALEAFDRVHNLRE